MSQPKREGRRVTLEEARRLCASERVIDIVWRPEEGLPEEGQYALIYGEE
jgi:hypothetical protein